MAWSTKSIHKTKKHLGTSRAVKTGPFPGGWRSEAVGHHSAADEELGVCTSHWPEQWWQEQWDHAGRPQRQAQGPGLINILQILYLMNPIESTWYFLVFPGIWGARHPQFCWWIGHIAILVAIFFTFSHEIFRGYIFRNQWDQHLSWRTSHIQSLSTLW